MPITLSVPHSRGILRLALLGLLALPLACPQTDPTNEDGGADGTVVDGAPAGEWVAAPHIDAISPTTQAGGQAFTLTVNGSGLGGGAEILLADTPLKTDPISSTQLKAAVAPQKRGALAVTVRRGIATSNAVTLTITNTPPTIAAVGDQSVDEDKALLVKLQVTDLDGDTPRVFVSGQPPGAAFDEVKRELRFTPDFIQGGQSWTVDVTATDGAASAAAQFTITAKDTIKPPTPTVVESTPYGDHTRLKLAQTTDSYLDSPGYAGRSLEARVVVPKAASASNRFPVRIELHGFTGWPSTGGSGAEFAIHPHDPMDTYWWGYSDQLPAGAPTKGTVPNYTQRRVLHLLEWVLKTYPGADPDRTYVTGGSMGGAGAKTLGLLYARHFCYIEATIGQAIPRNHRPLRITQLSTLWGAPALNLPDGMTSTGIWDRMDLTATVRDLPEAREQFAFTKHSKDDTLIHFGAVVMKSPLTNVCFYDALRDNHIGHYVVWDEGGHGSNDPVLGAFWSDWGWNRITDATTFLRRDLAFPAFAHSAADQDPGDGSGNGKQTWDENEGYAGLVETPRDTGWNGDIAGARNRFLRWDSTQIVDTEQHFEIPLEVLDGNGQPAPKPGYPSIGNKLDATVPVLVDVSLRRTQKFKCLPGSKVTWTFGAASGTATADTQGVITIPQLPLTTTWTKLAVDQSAN